jgi:hypothetical protein
MKRVSLWLIAAGLMFAATVPAQADPISTAIVTWIASAAFAASTAGAIAIAALDVAIAVGLSYAAQAIMGKPDQSGFQGTSGRLTAGGITPRTFIAGRGYTGGLLAYHNTWGKDGKTPNAYYVRVIKISDLPISALTDVFVGGVPVTYGSGSPDASMGYAIPEYYKDGKDHLWIKFYDGTQTAADAYLVSKFGSDPSYPYGTDRIGTGVAYIIATALVEPTLFSGWPDYKFAGDGILLYDPRKDSTIGGSGTHRFDDYSTWEFSNNPKVLEYNVLRGLRYGSNWFYGLQSLSATRLPTSSWFAAMNECDLSVGSTEGFEPQFRCGGEIAVNTQPADLIDEIEKSCNGRLAEIGGVYKTTVGAAGSAVLTFSDADLLSTEQQTFDQFPGLASLINGIAPSFPDPNQGWEMSDAPARLDSSLEAADGGRQLTSNIQYNLVPFAEQVQRLAQAALNEARRFRKHTVPLPPSAWAIEPLDVVAWNSNRNGYEAKTFRVDLATDQANLDMVLVITEVDPADYDWTPATDYIPYVAGPLQIQRPAVQPFSGWAVDGETIYGDGGLATAGIRFTWGTTDITDVNGILYEVRLAFDDSLKLAGETDHFSDGTLVVSQNLKPATNYEARGKFRPTTPNRETDWSSWLPVTTPDVRISVAELAAEIQDDLDQVVINTDALAIINRATSASDAALRSLRDDVSRSAQALLNIQMLLPQIEQTYQRQLVAYVAGITGTDVTAFSARLIDAESAIIDLKLGKATTTALTALDSQINTPSTGIAAQVDTLLETVALLDPSSATATLAQTIVAVRGQGIELSTLGSTVLEILNALNKIQAGQAATVAFVRNEFTANVTQGISANAEAIGEVGAILKTATEALQASVTNESSARVTGDSANASSISTVSATLTTEIANRAAGDSSNAADIATVAAAVTTESSARVSGDSANASSIASVSAALSTEVSDRTAAVATVAASVVTEASARVSGDSANASDITTIYSQLGDVNATGYFSVNTATAPGDASARVALQVSATAGGSPVTASLFMDALTAGGSRIVMIADKTVIASGSDVAALSDAFQFTAGTLYVKNAVIANLTAGNLSDGAATNGASSGGSASSTTSLQTLVTDTLNLAGGKPVDISIRCTGSCGGTSETFTFQVTVTTYDGATTVVDTYDGTLVCPSSSTRHTMVSAVSLGGSTGTCTVVVKGKSTGTSGSIGAFVWQTQVRR